MTAINSPPLCRGGRIFTDFAMCNRFSKNLGLGELSIAGVSGGSLTASGYITIPMIINGARRVLYIQWS
ncbi:hypothetical protein ACSVGK_23270, partial [Klebsiella pneumoniae]